MNEEINKFLLAGDKFMPEMHLKQPRLTCSACELFTKNKEGIQKFNQMGNSRYIYQNEPDMAYGDFKDLTKRRVSDKILRDKAFNIKTQNMMGIKGVLLQ